MRLSKPARATALSVHLLAATGWLGGLVALCVLRGPTRALWPILAASAALCVGTGALLGVGTPWGLWRYRWVITKWALAAAVGALAVLALRQPEFATPARAGAGALLGAAVVLSVVRPWGRRRGRSRGRHRSP